MGIVRAIDTIFDPFVDMVNRGLLKILSRPWVNVLKDKMIRQVLFPSGEHIDGHIV